jgi:hypothetical protein
MLAELQEEDSNIIQISYMYGNLKELAEKLKKKNNAPLIRGKVFPLVLLLEDILVDRTSPNYYGTASVNIVICNQTKKGLTSEQRESENFTKILRPMYHNMLYQIEQHKAVSVYSERRISHTMVERKLWGNDEKSANTLGFYIDAIDMLNVQLPINWEYCDYLTNQQI